jgi:hypothetical protein
VTLLRLAKRRVSRRGERLLDCGQRDRQARDSKRCGAGDRRLLRQAVDCWGRLIPVAEIEVAGDDGGCLLVALGDEVMKIFLGGADAEVRPMSNGTCASVASLRS